MKLTTHFASARQWRASVSLAFTASFLVAAAFTSSTATAAGLNDTGFTTCADAAGATVSCTAASAVQGQDARYGRDAAAGTSALTKVGGGANGFDFTKISNGNGTNPGAILPATAPLGTAAGEWGCTYDNTTGLMWEVKTTSGLRNSGLLYSWYSSNAATNGGIAGVENGGYCFTPGRCDTEKFVQDVNATNMCGHADWRVPTVRELLGIVRLGATPAIDTAYFPNTIVQITGGNTYPVSFWTATPIVSSSSIATIYFGNGNQYPFPPSGAFGSFARPTLRLVRSGL